MSKTNIAYWVYGRLNDGCASASGRIWPQSIPQPRAQGDLELPAVVYSIPSAVRVDAKKGRTGYVETRVRVASYAKSYKAAQDLADEIETALADYQGAWSGGDISRVKFLLSIDDWDEDVKAHSVKMDFMIHHNEVDRT